MTAATVNKRIATIATLAILLIVSITPVEAQTPGFASPAAFSRGGVASVVFTGGNLSDLQVAASASGASGAWVQDEMGRFLLLTIGGPTFLNQRFQDAFGTGFTGPTVVILTRATTPTGSVGTDSAVPPQVGSWIATQAPVGATTGSNEWIAIAAPSGKTIIANVTRPLAATGAVPVVVLLHGQSGFSNAYVDLAAEIAEAGFVVLTGCWFAGHYDGASSPDSPTPITDPEGLPCPDGPALKGVADPAAVNDVAALVMAAGTLAGVQSDRVALLGNSRGAIMALLTEATGTADLQAVVAIGGAPPGGPLLAARIAAPVFLLQGEADSVVPVTYAETLEQSLRTLGRTVQAHYYPNHGHGILFDTPLHGDALTRVVAFLDAELTR